MKKYLLMAITCLFSAMSLTGCGGGGGGGGNTTPAATQATTKVHLFGTMSSNSRIATVQTTMTVPSGIMVNYSSPAGSTSGTFSLRRGAVVPSGSVQVASADISATFDTASRKLSVSLVNQGRLPLRSSTTGRGEEIFTIFFTLASPGGTVPLPGEDALVSVGQEKQTPSGPAVDYLTGCSINYLTTFQ